MILGCQFSQNTSSVIFEEDMIETDNIENLGHKTCHHKDFSGILADLALTKNVHSYELNTSFFSDYSKQKNLFILQ